MASPFEPLPQSKRLRTVAFDKAIEKDTILDLEVYHSDDDLDYVEDDVDSSSEISSLEDVDIDTDVSDGGSSVSLDVSVADDPAILISRDGTKWYEDRFLVSPPLAETFIENHVPTVTTLGQEAKTLSGNRYSYAKGPIILPSIGVVTHPVISGTQKIYTVLHAGIG